MGAESILAEALIRIEHKLDLLLNVIHTGSAPQLHFAGQKCPVCDKFIDYQIDLQNNVVVRKCGCWSGKLPSIIPLTLTAQPEKVTSNGNTASNYDAPADSQGTENSNKR